MSLIQVLTIIVLITAVLAYLNARFIKLNSSIGLMILALVFSVLIILSKSWFSQSFLKSMNEVLDVNFSSIVLDIFLSFLLFAGAMKTDYSLIMKQRISIILFSFLSVIISCFLIAFTLYYLLQFFSISIPLSYCFLFGALISPTDPIAILSILIRGNIPKRIEINIVGESLFNDGIGVVLFISILSFIQLGESNFTIIDVFIRFIKESIGGLLFGFLLGHFLYYLVKSIDDYESEVLLTLAGVLGGTWLAHLIQVSAPLSMVIAGLITGHKTIHSMSDETQVYVEKFWHLIDLLLNAILFVLIGLKFTIISFQWTWLQVLFILIPLMILIRFVSLVIPNILASKWIQFSKKDLMIMTWGGLRGGLSIAMALSLSETMVDKQLLVSLTYGIVLFSIIVQGLTMSRLVKKFYL